MTDVLSDLSKVSGLTPYDMSRLTEGRGTAGLEIFGRVKSEVKATSYLSRLTLTGGVFILVDVVSVSSLNGNLPGSDSKAGLTPGSLIAVAPDDSCVGKWVRIRRTADVGAKVKSNLRQQPTESVSCLNFTKSPSGDWTVFPNYIIVDDLNEGTTEHSLASRVENLASARDRAFSEALLENLSIRSFSGMPDDMLEEVSTGVDEGDGVSAPSSTGSTLKGDLPDDAPKDLVHRLQIADKFEGIDAVQEELSRCYEALCNFYDSIHTDVKAHYWVRNAVITAFIENILGAFGKTIPGTKTSKDSIISSLVTMAELNSTQRREVEMFLRDDREYLRRGGTGVDVFENLDALFLMILDAVIGTHTFPGVSRDLERPINYAGYVLRIIDNPYTAGLIDNYSFSDATKLYWFIKGIAGDEWYEQREDALDRSKDMLAGLEALSGDGDNSTLVPKTRVVEAKLPELLGLHYKAAASLNSYGRVFPSFNFPLVTLLARTAANIAKTRGINSDVDGNILGLYARTDYALHENSVNPGNGIDSMTWGTVDKNGMKPYVNPDRMIKDLDKHGFAITVEDYMISYQFLKMETYIYEKTHRMGSTGTGVTQEQIDEGIASYEASVGFHLEGLQKDGVGLVAYQSAVLSGQAGSGKTTVSEAFIRILKSAIPGCTVYLAAPTGKAARRMKEVVGHLGEVKTLHSLFKLGIGGVDRFEGIRYDPRGVSAEASEGRSVYIIDESAMITTQVLYNALRRISEDSLVYYLGDIKQLTPIGKGVPFRDMLEYMPAVELGVSKRAKEGSGINKNCDIINQHSYAGDFQELVNTDDFSLVSCSDSSLADYIVSGVQSNVSKYENPEDIQVATAYATAKREHSSTSLNPKLQEVFLPDAEVLFTLSPSGTRFKKGCRVIHTKKNIYGKLKYAWDGENIFVQVPTIGVVNGETGRLVGIVPASSAIIQEDDDFNKEAEDEGKTLHKASTVVEERDPRAYFAVVEVDDPDYGKPCNVLYKLTSRASRTEADGLLGYGEVNMLELAYALTVHKLQGSQAKMIVMPLSSNDNPGFVDRNMVYTGVSRAQERVVLIGSVDGNNSMLSNARRNTSVNAIKSMLSVYAGVLEL